MYEYNRGLIGLAPRRKAAGYTQEAFAAELEVSRSLLAAWETLRCWPMAGVLPKMADLLLCSIDDLYRLPEGASIPEGGDDAQCSPTAAISTKGQGVLPA